MTTEEETGLVRRFTSIPRMEFGDPTAVINPFQVVDLKDQAYDTSVEDGGSFDWLEFFRTQVLAVAYGEFFSCLLVSIVIAIAFSLGSGVATTAPLTTLGIAVAVGCAYCAVVAAFGHVSGAHTNPMVSCTMFLMHVSHYAWAGGVWLILRDVILLVTQFACQLIGWIVGVSIAWYIINDSSATGNLGLPALGTLDGDTITNGRAFFFEFILVFVYLLVYAFAVVDRKLKHGSIVLGVTMTAIHLIGIGLTGANLNMWRWLVTYFITGSEDNTFFGGYIFASWVPPLIVLLFVEIWRRSIEPTSDGERHMMSAPEYPPHNKYNQDKKEEQMSSGNKRYVARNIIRSRGRAPRRMARGRNTGRRSR